MNEEELAASKAAAEYLGKLQYLEIPGNTWIYLALPGNSWKYWEYYRKPENTWEFFMLVNCR